MHSKIIQLSTKPVTDESYITEDKYYDGFCGWIADYVDDGISEENRAAIISDFKDSVYNTFPEFVELGDESITFKDGFSQEHNRVMTQTVRRLVETGSYADWRYHLKTLISDDYGFYVDSDWGGLETEESFLSGCLDGMTFYFGAVIDYHY